MRVVPIVYWHLWLFDQPGRAPKRCADCYPDDDAGLMHSICMNIVAHKALFVHICIMSRSRRHTCTSRTTQYWALHSRYCCISPISVALASDSSHLLFERAGSLSCCIFGEKERAIRAWQPRRKFFQSNRRAIKPSWREKDLAPSARGRPPKWSSFPRGQCHGYCAGDCARLEIIVHTFCVEGSEFEKRVLLRRFVCTLIVKIRRSKPGPSRYHKVHLFSRLQSRLLSELTRQLAPPTTKNDHAPLPTESRKSYQSVNPSGIWA